MLRTSMLDRNVLFNLRFSVRVVERVGMVWRMLVRMVGLLA